MNLDTTAALTLRDYASPGKWPRWACVAFIAGAGGLFWWGIIEVLW